MASRDTAKHKLRPPADLQRASLAVQFEVVTLWQSHKELQELAAHLGSPPEVQFANNVLLHSLLLASRNLLAFLYSYNPRPTDIIAEDFFSDPTTWQKQRLVPEVVMANGELIGQISKRLAHLTWDRVDQTKPLWGGFRIAWNVGLGLQSFLDLVDDTLVHEQLREDVRLGMATLRAEANKWSGANVGMAPAQSLIEFDETEYFRLDSDAIDSDSGTPS